MAKDRDLEIQDWKSQFQERLDRGLSVSQFCKEKGITENMYYHRGRAIRKADPEFMAHLRKRAEHLPSESFVEIKVDPEESTATFSAADTDMERIEVERTPAAVIRMDSMEIDLFQNASAPFLAELLKAVRHA